MAGGCRTSRGTDHNHSTATFSSFYRNLYLGGAVRHSLISTWASGNSTKPAGAIANTNWNQILLHLPLSGTDDQIGWPIPWLEEMLTHPSPDRYWKPLDVTDELPRLKLPIQHVVGYYDFFSRESVNNFAIMNKAAVDAETRKNQQLISVRGTTEQSASERSAISTLVRKLSGMLQEPLWSGLTGT